MNDFVIIKTELGVIEQTSIFTEELKMYTNSRQRLEYWSYPQQYEQKNSTRYQGSNLGHASDGLLDHGS